MDDRRVELQEALSQGDDAAVLEITSTMAQCRAHGADETPYARRRVGHAINPRRVSFCSILMVGRVVAHQCGLRGCRVGEASNPGPRIAGDERWHVAVTRQSLFGSYGVGIGEASHPGRRHKRRRRVVASETSGSEPEATLLDALEQDLAGSPDPRSSEGTVVGGAIHHDLTLVDRRDHHVGWCWSPSQLMALHSQSRTVTRLNRQPVR